VSWAWAEYSASAGWAATVLDQSIAQSAPGTPTTFTSSTLTTTVNEEVLVYGCRVQSALTGTSAGFTTETNNSSAQWISLVDRVVSSSGGYAATCTVASAEFIDVAFGTFKTTTAGGGTPIKKKVTNSKLQKNTGNNKLQKG